MKRTALLLLLACGGQLEETANPFCPSSAANIACCPWEAGMHRCIDGHRFECQLDVKGVSNDGGPEDYYDIWNYVGECPP